MLPSSKLWTSTFRLLISSNGSNDADTNREPVVLTFPPTFNPPLIDAVAFTSNLKSGVKDAVTEPVAIAACNGKSSALSEIGISNKSLPLPLNAPLISFTTILSPLIVFPKEILSWTSKSPFKSKLPCISVLLYNSIEALCIYSSTT